MTSNEQVFDFSSVLYANNTGVCRHLREATSIIRVAFGAGSKHKRFAAHTDCCEREGTHLHNSSLEKDSILCVTGNMALPFGRVVYTPSHAYF